MVWALAMLLASTRWRIMESDIPDIAVKIRRSIQYTPIVPSPSKGSGPQVEDRLRNLARRVDCLGICLEVALCRDQPDEFVGDVHVRTLQRAGLQVAERTCAGFAVSCRPRQ